MKRWIVTGACGFQGGHLVDHLVASGDDVVAIDLPGADTRWVDRAGVPFLAADVTRPELLEPAMARAVQVMGGCDGVFHFAELASYAQPPELYRAVHVDGTENVVRAMERHGIRRFMLLSTGGVYGRPVRIPSLESDAPAPLTDYDRSKVAQEVWVQEAHEAGRIDATIVRPAAVYGPRSRKRAATPLFLMALGQLPAVPGRGDVYAALVHVYDVAAASRHLMLHEGSVGETYNIADDTLMTLHDILSDLAPHVDARLNNVHLPLWGLKALGWWTMRRSRKTGRPPRIEPAVLELLVHDTFMSNRRLKLTGYQLLRPNYVVGMVETIEWYKEHNWLWRDEAFERRLSGRRRAPGIMDEWPLDPATRTPTREAKRRRRRQRFGLGRRRDPSTHDAGADTVSIQHRMAANTMDADAAANDPGDAPSGHRPVVDDDAMKKTRRGDPPATDTDARGEDS